MVGEMPMGFPEAAGRLLGNRTLGYKHHWLGPLGLFICSYGQNACLFQGGMLLFPVTILKELDRTEANITARERVNKYTWQDSFVQY